VKVNRNNTDIVLDLNDLIYFVTPEDALVVAHALNRYCKEHGFAEIRLNSDLHLAIRSDDSGVRLGLFNPGKTYELSPPMSRAEAEQTAKKIEALFAQK
jgi:hypothetical protein